MQSPYRFCNLFFKIKINSAIVCKTLKTVLAAYATPMPLFSGFASDCRTQYTTIHIIAKVSSFFSYNFFISFPPFHPFSFFLLCSAILRFILSASSFSRYHFTRYDSTSQTANHSSFLTYYFINYVLFHKILQQLIFQLTSLINFCWK